MPVSIIVTGMVLSAMPVGDYDKRLVILTKETGKITAFAKGARRPNSALLACSQPFSFGEFTLYSGRSSYTIISSEISNYFSELRDDIDSVYYGLYFCEFADYITKENNEEKEILKLLYQTLRAVVMKKLELSLIRTIFELKIISLNGEAPQVFQCVKCGKDSKEYFFSAESGGVLCEQCQYVDRSSVKLSTSTLYALQYIVSREVEKLFSFTVKEDILRELKLCVSNYLGRYIDHKFKSLELIETLAKIF